MLEELFAGNGYYEYPSFEVAIFSLLLSFVLSTGIAFTYRITYKGDNFPRHFFQAIILSSIVTSMIMMAVGNNFAVGFGIIGAVAIIRFRTLINDPRNIIFMFAGISVGIASGVYGYNIAIAGTIVFCLVAFLLYFYHNIKKDRYEFELNVVLDEKVFKGDMQELLKPYCKKVRLDTQRKNNASIRNVFVLKLKDKISEKEFFDHLATIDGIEQFRIDKNEVRMKL